MAALAIVLSTGAALPGVALPSAALPVPAQAATEEELMLPVGPEPDGTAVSLDVSVLVPGGPGPHPAVLLGHGFGGTKRSVATEAGELRDSGYVVVTWTARGFGQSGGRIHLNDPALEVADAKALVDLVAARDDIRLDDSGDPRVGAMGASYGGALSLMLAGADPRVDGVVAAITWHDLADAFFPQSAIGTGEPGPFKQVWASSFFLGAIAPLALVAGPGDDPVTDAEGSASVCGRFDPTICTLFVRASEDGTASPELLDLLRAHSPAPTLDRVTAPTLLIQGTADSLFGLDQADATARALDRAGTTVAVRWSDGGHDGPSSHEAAETDAAHAWLDHYVADGAGRESPSPATGFVYPTPPDRRSQPATLWTASAYPGLGGAEQPTATVPLEDAGGTMLRPPGGQPAGMVAVPGLSGLAAGLASYPLAALPGQSVAIDTAPVPDGVTVAGSPTITLTITSSEPTATFFASLWRLNGETPTLPHALVAPVRVPVTPGEPTEVTVALPAATYEMPTGSRWRVLLTATEAGFANARTPAVLDVRAGDSLTVPVITGVRVGAESGLDTEARTAIALIAALLLLAAVAGAVRLRRRRHEPSRADLADVPLVVDSLVKTYSDGHRAVDDVSWRAEKGQVVGLLGPNGAGKTTTMRMVMGLIRPDTGASYVLGHPAGPGAPVLDRVGALIEGPGFLPHLTGRANLEAYWAATGRRPEDARIDEALEVAALGGAIDRPVKSYSHGMKQRLGIAQAMLGLPELLVLDEPTNGLDPPQIAAMRPILRRYAESGRTVVISSHLLAEVELTCTHVVVMHAGRVVTTGPVAELLDSDDTTVLDLAEGADAHDAHDAVDALRRAVGIGEVRVDTPTRLVVVADVPRAEVVRAAVVAGLDVVGVSSRRHLEEVFLGVINAASGNSPGTLPGPDDPALIERLRQVRAR